MSPYRLPDPKISRVTPDADKIIYNWRKKIKDEGASGDPERIYKESIHRYQGIGKKLNAVNPMIFR